MTPKSTFYERVRTAAEAAADRLDARGIDVAVVLGSGLAPAVTALLQQERSVAYASLPGFPKTTVAGHPGRLACGMVGNRKVLVLCGRVHGYEGYPASEVGFGVRVCAALGADTLIVTNVSGGVDPALKPGDIAVISDHINLTGTSPLTGANDEHMGPRFVDLTDAYCPTLRGVAHKVAAESGVGPLREAVYAGMAGPQYETPAEVRMLRLLGAGLVGMSTVNEVIVARHAAMRVLGLSLVANPAAGVEPNPLNHEDVTRVATQGADKLGALIADIVAAL